MGEQYIKNKLIIKQYMKDCHIISNKSGTGNAMNSI